MIVSALKRAQPSRPPRRAAPPGNAAGSADAESAFAQPGREGRDATQAKEVPAVSRTEGSAGVAGRKPQAGSKGRDENRAGGARGCHREVSKMSSFGYKAGDAGATEARRNVENQDAMMDTSTTSENSGLAVATLAHCGPSGAAN